MCALQANLAPPFVGPLSQFSSAPLCAPSRCLVFGAHTKCRRLCPPRIALAPSLGVSDRSGPFRAVARAPSPEGNQNFRRPKRVRACLASCRASTGSTNLSPRRPSPRSVRRLATSLPKRHQFRFVTGSRGFPASPLTTNSATVASPPIFGLDIFSVSDNKLTATVRATTTFEQRSSPHLFEIAASATSRSRAVNSVTKAKRKRGKIGPKFFPFRQSSFLSFFSIFFFRRSGARKNEIPLV